MSAGAASFNQKRGDGERMRQDRPRRRAPRADRGLRGPGAHWRRLLDDAAELELFVFFFKQKTAYEITYGDLEFRRVLFRSAANRRSSPGRRRSAARRDWPGRTPAPPRSEERRVGKECRRLCRSRLSPYHLKKKKIQLNITYQTKRENNNEEQR